MFWRNEKVTKITYISHSTTETTKFDSTEVGQFDETGDT